MPDQLRVGVIGAGFMGRVHSQAARSSGAKLEMIASSSSLKAEVAAKEFGFERFSSSAEELIADSRVDVIHICTPNSTHTRLALAALRAGKHVICEKPLASSSVDARELVAAANSANLVATVPFVYRFHPLVREARNRVKQGKTGKIISVRGSYLQDWLLSAEDTNWRVDENAGGPSRAFADIGSHLVDLIEFVTDDRIQSLTAITNIAHEQRGDKQVNTEDEAALLFRSERGAVGTLMVSQVAPGRKNRLLIDISGTSESLEFNQEHPESLWIGRRRESVLLPRDESQNSPEANVYSKIPSGHPMGYMDAFASFVSDTYRKIAGQKIDGLPEFSAGLRATLVLDALLESAASKQWVQVKDQ